MPQGKNVELPPNSAVLNNANQPIAESTGEFKGCVSFGQSGNVGVPIFQLQKKNQTITESGKGNITILSPNNLEVVEVTSEAGVARTGPTTDHSRLTPLPKGTQASVTGREGNWLRLDYGAWILASETTNGYSNKTELDQWKNMYKNDSRIKLLKSAQNHYEIAQIMNDADCGLFPSRAEGWNLELLEMMSMNKPVIATNYSAHTEFCDKENCYLVDINEKEKAYDGKAFIGQGNWAKIGTKQKDQIVENMRYCFNNNIKTNSQGILTAQKYSWVNSAQTLLRCIDNS
jgi:hypothetical protein